jgi:hypothetical protein
MESKLLACISDRLNFSTLARSKIARDLVIGCDGRMLLITQTGLRGWMFHMDDTVEHPDCQSFRAGEVF